MPVKTISAGLKALLTSNKTILREELLTITLGNGTALYYTSGQQNLAYNGHTFLAPNQGVNPGWKRGSITTKLGMDVQTLELTLLGGPATMIGSITLQAFAEGGGFDGAIVEVDCLPMETWGVTANGTYNLWTGVVGEVKPDRTKVEIEVQSMMRVLQGSFPRNYFQPTCNHTLFDAGCTLSKAAFAVAGIVAAGSWTTAQFGSNLTQANDYFDLGWVAWTSGQNDGLVRTVKTYTQSGGNILLIDPLPYVPQSGDTFTAYPGCDKTQTTCTNKFNNLAHFRGFPYMPVPTTLVAGQGTSAPAGSGGVAGNAGGKGGAGGNFKQF